MGAAAAIASPGDLAPAKAGKGKKAGKKKLILLAIPVLLLAVLAGLWFTGILPGLLGLSHAAHEEHAAETGTHVPVFVELPEMIANLNAPGRRASFVKLKARLELARPEDQAAFTAGLPRIVDLFQTYLREMRPGGVPRLGRHLPAAGGIDHPLQHRPGPRARVVDVLFSELLVQ